VETQVHNSGTAPIEATISADPEGYMLEQKVMIGAGETQNVRFTPDRFPELRIRKPELWWPRQMGKPALHSLSVYADVAGVISDTAFIDYGIREITSDIDPQGHRLFRVNGKRILIRGGGWAPDMLERESSDRLKTQFDYLSDLNLNTIRLEGQIE